MVKNIFANSSRFWNWLVVSSADPASVALTVKGFFSLTIVQTLFGLLPLVGIHPTFTLDVVGADAYTIVYSVATAITSLITAYGILRKAIVTIHNLVPAPVQKASTPSGSAAVASTAAPTSQQ